MFKKLSLAITFYFLILSAAFSQVEFGIDAAFGASKLRIDNPSSAPDLFQSNTNAFAMNFGPAITVGLRDHWSLHMGIDLSFNPSSLLFNGDTSYAVNTSFTKEEKTYQNLFIEVPVMARFHIVSRERPVSPYLAFGAVYDYQLLESCPKGLECLDHTRDHNLGAIVGIGVEFWRLNVGAKAELGLLNTITDDYKINKSDLKINKDLLLVEIGYTFE